MSGNARVLDSLDRPLSPCSEDRAIKLIGSGKAELVSESPLIIRLLRKIDIPTPKPEPPHVLDGQQILLHICCGPCATYTVKRLRALGANVTGYWHNPNIHPFSEHERRLETLLGYAGEIDLSVIQSESYEMPAFFRAVVGHEQFRERCAICYRLRLERAARDAAEQGIGWFTTTLLISPHQDQDLICALGHELGDKYGVRFYYENFRRGFREHNEMARAHDLYMQNYCGCIYSEWEAEIARQRRQVGDEERQTPTG